MKVLVLGMDGMLGHVVFNYFKEKNYDTYGTSRRDDENLFFDVQKDINHFEDIVSSLKPDVVVNCIGILNKDAEENQGKAVLINSYLPHYIDELSYKYNFKYIHISTDCIFEGTKGNYDENAKSDATSFYGRSKALGEINNSKNVTLRTSIVGPDNNKNGIGLFKWFINQKDEVSGYTKVIWTGVTTIELAKQIETAIKNDLIGIQHVVNNDQISKKDLLELFKKHFGKKIDIKDNNDVVSKKTLIRTDKSYNFDIPSYDKMVEEMKEWVLNHESLYSNIFENTELKSKEKIK